MRVRERYRRINHSFRLVWETRPEEENALGDEALGAGIAALRDLQGRMLHGQGGSAVHLHPSRPGPNESTRAERGDAAGHPVRHPAAVARRRRAAARAGR